MEEEIWRDIRGFEGLYQVSNFGRVRSLFRYKMVVKPYMNKWGYLEVNLYRDNKMIHKKIHRLVAEAFVPNPENKPCVDHIDTNKLNNIPSNLRWCTHKENSNNPLSLKHLSDALSGEKNYWFGKKQPESMRKKRSESTSGEKAYWYGKKRDAETIEKMRQATLSRGWVGAKHPNAKPVLQISKIDGSVIRRWECAAEASGKTSVCASKISLSCNGKRKTAGGYIWRYASGANFEEQLINE